MVNVYITKKFISNIRYLPLLYPFLGPIKDEKRIFADRGEQALREPVFNLAENIEGADFILFPHDFYFFMVGMIPRDFLDEHVLLAQKHKKKLLIFDLGDLTEKEIDVPNSIVFRIAGYASRRKENEIIMPNIAEDLSEYQEIIWREKGERPVIGFCGWGDLKNTGQKIKLWLKNFLVFDKTHCRGIYFRMRAIKILKKCKNITTNFIVRKSYSSHKSTIELPSEEARKQYIENIINSDFTLCVRGDANSSYRFFETLSLGRIPLVVDTDCVFPLQDVIDYNKFSLIVDYKNIDDICEIVGNFYKEINNEDFIKMQKAGRAVFENYLSATAFLKYILPKLK